MLMKHNNTVRSESRCTLIKGVGILEVMSTSVYTGLNPFNFIRNFCRSACEMFLGISQQIAPALNRCVRCLLERLFRLTTKSTYHSLSALRLSECIVLSSLRNCTPHCEKNLWGSRDRLAPLIIKLVIEGVSGWLQAPVPVQQESWVNQSQPERHGGEQNLCRCWSSRR